MNELKILKLVELNKLKVYFVWTFVELQQILLLRFI